MLRHTIVLFQVAYHSDIDTEAQKFFCHPAVQECLAVLRQQKVPYRVRTICL